MQPINMMIYYHWDEKLKKTLDILQADIKAILKNTLIWCL